MVSMNGNGSEQPAKRRVTGQEVVQIGTLMVAGDVADHCEENGYHPIILAARFASGDWGDVQQWVVRKNERMIKIGGPTLGVYKVAGKMIMIGNNPKTRTTMIDFLPDDVEGLTT